MNTVTVWGFARTDGAEQALLELEPAVRGGLVGVSDAALVSWPPERRKPITRSLGAITRPGELWGGFWGVLLALVFLVPLAGPNFGAAAGAVAGGLADFGVADDFLKRIRDTVVPGTSALFVVSSRADAVALAGELDGLGAELARSELSPEQERQLRDALGDR